MIKKFIILFILLILSFSFFSPISTTLHLITDDEFSPYSYTENEIVKGIDIEIIDELMSRLHINYKLNVVPWARLLNMTKNGLCDLSFSLFKTAEREKYSIYTNLPIHKSIYKVYVKKENEFKFDSIEDLYGKTVGLNIGFFISKEFDQAVKEGKIKLIQIEGVKDMIKRLKYNLLDCFIGNYHGTQFELKRMNLLSEIIPLKKQINDDKNAYLVISKQAKIQNKQFLLNSINSTLQKMYNDGTIEKITKKYINKN